MPKFKKIGVAQVAYIQLQSYVDGTDGTLAIAEAKKNIPFEIKRVYYIYNLLKHNNAVRGKHAHKTLAQAIFCLQGSCTIHCDDGKNTEDIVLNDPTVGLYLGPRLWIAMKDFANNCILLVMASEKYREDDYIRNHNDFLKFIDMA